MGYRAALHQKDVLREWHGMSSEDIAGGGVEEVERQSSAIARLHLQPTSTSISSSAIANGLLKVAATNRSKLYNE